jgi:hypothetical protein
MSIKTPYDISATNKILLYEPTERGILWIIENDPSAFVTTLILDVLKNPQLLDSKVDNASTKNLAKALPIYMKLHQRGFIKQDGIKIVITWKGKLFRLYTHPSISFWGALFAIIIGIITLIVSILVLLRTETHTRQQETTKQVQQPTSYLPPYHQKKDISLPN